MYKVYILQSEKNGKYYIGHTQDLVVRLKRHNSGLVSSTKRYVPWKIVYTESCNTKQEAYKRELKIKSYKSGEAFKNLVVKNGWIPERSKGADCKSAGSAFVGSNPTPPTW